MTVRRLGVEVQSYRKSPSKIDLKHSWRNARRMSVSKRTVGSALRVVFFTWLFVIAVALWQMR